MLTTLTRKHTEEETNLAAVNNQNPQAANACQAIRPRASGGRAFLLFVRCNKARGAPHQGYLPTVANNEEYFGN